MGKPEFAYVIEPGDNNGFIWITEKETDCKSNEMLYIDNENILTETLKKYKKRYILSDYDTPEFLKEGERLAKKLNLKFLHV